MEKKQIISAIKNKKIIGLIAIIGLVSPLIMQAAAWYPAPSHIWYPAPSPVWYPAPSPVWYPAPSHAWYPAPSPAFNPARHNYSTLTNEQLEEKLKVWIAQPESNYVKHEIIAAIVAEQEKRRLQARQTPAYNPAYNPTHSSTFNPARHNYSTLTNNELEEKLKVWEAQPESNSVKYEIMAAIEAEQEKRHMPVRQAELLMPLTKPLPTQQVKAQLLPETAPHANLMVPYIPTAVPTVRNPTLRRYDFSKEANARLETLLNEWTQHQAQEEQTLRRIQAEQADRVLANVPNRPNVPQVTVAPQVNVPRIQPEQNVPGLTIVPAENTSRIEPEPMNIMNISLTELQGYNEEKLRHIAQAKNIEIGSRWDKQTLIEAILAGQVTRKADAERQLMLPY